METKTAFSLNQNIANWKKELTQNPSLSVENSEELESHLLDEIDQLKILGLNEEESLTIAKSRIGSIDQLSTEFNKVNTNLYFLNRILPYLNGVLIFVAFTSISKFISSGTMLISSWLGAYGSFLNWISIGVLSTFTLVLFGFIYSNYRFGKFNFNTLKNIPFLVITITVSRTVTFLSLPLIAQTLDSTVFGLLKLHLGIYQILMMIFILAISLILSYKSTKKIQIKVA